MSFNNTFNNKKVLVTGHTGFKGSWLIYWLHTLGANVKGYALAPETDTLSLFDLINGNTLCTSVIADIRNKDRVEEEVLNFEPDFIFHLAAQPLVRLSYQIPEETFETNILGTAYLLTAVRKLTSKCTVVVITTDKVYDNKEWLYPYRELDPLGGYDPYSASKACAEMVSNSYTKSFFSIKDYDVHQKGIATARAGNVIGGGDWSKDRIMPDIIMSLEAGIPLNLRNPMAVRPWQHVLEPLSGYLDLAMHLDQNPVDYTGAWNFGPNANDNLTVEEIVKLAIKKWGSGGYRKAELKDAPHEASLLKLDINKAITKLKWKPVWNSETAIEKTIRWYKGFRNVNAKSLMQQDIEDYLVNSHTL